MNVQWTSGDQDLLVQNGSSLLFTPANWNQYQTVTLLAGNDADASDGQAQFQVSAVDWTSVAVTASEIDDDRNIEVVPLDEFVAEDGTRRYGVRLLGQPESDVAVTTARTSGDNDLAITEGASLIFSTDNWAVLRAITVEAADDIDSLDGSAVFQSTAATWASASTPVTEADDDRHFTLSSQVAAVNENGNMTFDLTLAG